MNRAKSRAFTYAANLWGSLLNSSVPIKINACWASLPAGVFGHSGANASYRDLGAGQANTLYSVALANALSGGATSTFSRSAAAVAIAIG